MNNSRTTVTDGVFAVHVEGLDLSGMRGVLTSLTPGASLPMSIQPALDVSLGDDGKVILTLRAEPANAVVATASPAPAAMSMPTKADRARMSETELVAMVLAEIEPEVALADRSTLQNADAKIEGSVSQDAYDEVCVSEAWPPSEELIERYGTWRTALVAAGVQPTRGARAYHPIECRRVLDAAVEYYGGRMPTPAQFDNYVEIFGGPIAVTVNKRLGCWS